MTVQTHTAWQYRNPADLIGRRCIALTGCGSASEPSTPAHEVRSIESQCSDMDDDFSECVITLTDTRKVDCVVYSDYKQGGLSCDWSHVSGADKEPAR